MLPVNDILYLVLLTFLTYCTLLHAFKQTKTFSVLCVFNSSLLPVPLLMISYFKQLVQVYTCLGFFPFCIKTRRAMIITWSPSLRTTMLACSTTANNITAQSSRRMFVVMFANAYGTYKTGSFKSHIHA